MAQTGFTPLSLYYSSTTGNAPAAGNLVAGELALNITDGKLFYKDNAGAVQVMATKAAASGTFTNPALTSILEPGTNVATAIPASTNFDVLTQAILSYTVSATANFSLNVRGNSSTALNSVMSNNQWLTISLLSKNGTSAYYLTTLLIDGVVVTPQWQGGTAPSSGNASATDVYTFAINKTAAATYSVIASLTKFA